MQDFDSGVTLYEYDPNGNKIYKEYPNNETAWYSYDVCDQIIELDEYGLGGKKLYKTTYIWDAEGNRLSEMQYNHGRSPNATTGLDALAEAPPPMMPPQPPIPKSRKAPRCGDNILDFFGLRMTDPAAPSVDLSGPDLQATSAESPIDNAVALPDPTANTTADVFLNAAAETSADINAALIQMANESAEPDVAEPEAPTATAPPGGR